MQIPFLKEIYKDIYKDIKKEPEKYKKIYRKSAFAEMYTSFGESILKSADVFFGDKESFQAFSKHLASIYSYRIFILLYSFI